MYVEMVDICQKCGDRGFLEALNYCKKCQAYPIHRYCLDPLPESFDEYVTWLCEDCEATILPTVNSKVQLKKEKLVKRLEKKKKKKKKKKKTKRNDDYGQSNPLQLPEAHCSEKKNDTTPGGPGEPVCEGGASHSQVATSSDACNSMRHDYYVAQPIVDPVWRGTLNFWNQSISRVCVVVAHVSSLACSKVYEEAKMLPELLSVELLRRCDVWPRGFKKLGPTDQSIALYFFPDEESQKAFDLLVNAMMCQDLAMKAVLKNAELLVFTSSMLPMRYWRFQTKYYLWGVFRGKQVQPRNNVASEEGSFADSSPLLGL
ncbi:uncharacterized protein LOC120086715 isoform X2 [Benincasa hispida]|uniref:uncharacterized protein LOC120086715 isoform X2 n=1 Tax=Benincasa hispida TaxID=102211 RepID=UPI00190282D1|nr:uncharacterized protein LOC120086715 isoform X2 [Benincasa hispida]